MQPDQTEPGVIQPEAELPEANDATYVDEPIYWQADEHANQARSPKWYVGFGIVVLVFMAVAVLLMRSWSFAIVIAVAAVTLVVYTGRSPRQIRYTLSYKGLYVDDKLYPIENYKAFGVYRDSEQFTLVLLPTKRFMPGLTAYFPEEAGEQIVDILADIIPMQDIKPDMVDQLVRKLRL